MKRDLDMMNAFLDDVWNIWKKYPELRLMQLLLSTDAGYYTEDEALLKKLQEFDEKLSVQKTP